MPTPVFIPALLTPFTPSLALDLPAFRRIAAAQIDAGAASLLIAGTTGEGCALTEDERTALLAAAQEVMRERGVTLPLIVGAGTSDTASSCAHASCAARAGASSLLVVTPPYVKPSPAGLCGHLRTVYEASGLPIVLYHVPPRTGQTLPLSAFERIAASCPFVTGIKEASGELMLLSRLREAFGSRFALYCGCDELNFPALCLGADGLMSVLALPRPHLVAALCRAVGEGDLTRARELHGESMPVVRELFSQVNPVAVKRMMEKEGVCGRWVRKPLSEEDVPSLSCAPSSGRHARSD